jgi:hypothetical protein
MPYRKTNKWFMPPRASYLAPAGSTAGFAAFAKGKDASITGVAGTTRGSEFSAVSS